MVVSYAQLEHLLGSIIHVCLDLTHQEGRLAVRAPRASERFTLLTDLIALYGVKPKADLEALAARITKCQQQRDQLAHGVWLMNDAKTRLLLRLTRGTWQPTKGQRGKTKRVSHPEGSPYSETDAKALDAYIQETNDLVIALSVEIETALLPSRRKHPRPPGTADRAPDRKP